MSVPRQPVPLPQPVAAPSEPPAPTDTAEEVASEEPGDSPADKASQTSGTIIRAVTMRADPSNRGRAIAVIPAGAEVQVEPCKYWCKVEFNGTSGWVFKKFLSH
jgi:hypothetical protein